MNIGLTLLTLTVVLASSFIFMEAYAEISPNNSFIIEGTGYLATEESIKTSEIDLILETGDQTGSRINLDIENGFLTINDDDYLITSSSATSLREGKYLRISATAESPNTGDEISISTLGRLIQNSDQGSIYTFTGRVVDGNTEYKIIYIGQLSDLLSSSISPTTLEPTTNSDIMTVHIVEGASFSDLGASYIGASNSQLASYFSTDRLSITPGTSVTFINDDTVSHTLVSGTGLSSSGRVNSGGFTVCDEQIESQEGSSFTADNCDFTLDGRLNSKVIAPGESWTATFTEMGFYRLIDTDYPWMNIVAYVFPESLSQVINQGSNPLGN